MENADWLYKLRPVNFIYNEDSTHKIQYGLIAEEVEKINNAFVFYKDDRVEGVNYSQFMSPVIKALQDQKILIDKILDENKTIGEENKLLKMKLKEMDEINNRLNKLEQTLTLKTAKN